MKQTVSLACSVAALTIATLGSTPLGEAARNTVSQIVPRNSVGTLQLQRNAVKAAKIAPNAVRTSHVLDGTLLAADFKSGELPSGPKGDKGERGDKGDRGTPGATNVVVRTSTPILSTGPSFANQTASCNAGERAVGGGAGLTSGGSGGGFDLVDSKPSPPTVGGTPTAWNAGFSWTASGITVATFVVCASP